MKNDNLKDLNEFDSITKNEIRELINKNEKFKLIDVRDTPEYNKEHIIGAIHFLISEMTAEKAKSMLDVNDLIIVYSEDINCPAKTIAAGKLRGFGFKKIMVYPGSWKDWKMAGYPVEK